MLGHLIQLSCGYFKNSRWTVCPRFTASGLVVPCRGIEGCLSWFLVLPLLSRLWKTAREGIFWALWTPQTQTGDMAIESTWKQTISCHMTSMAYQTQVMSVRTASWTHTYRHACYMANQEIHSKPVKRVEPKVFTNDQKSEWSPQS